MMCFVQYQVLISEAALLQTQSKWYKLLFSACLGATKLGFGGKFECDSKLFAILLKITLKFDFFASFLNFVTKVYVRLSFNDSYRCLNFLFCFWVIKIH